MASRRPEHVVVDRISDVQTWQADAGRADTRSQPSRDRSKYRKC